MSNYCEKDRKHDCCNFDCHNEARGECDKYKEKSDELYLKGHCIQEESKKLACEAKELEEEARELEYRAKQLCVKANMTWDNAMKLETEAANILDLACFYACKASECYKNMQHASICKPRCNTSCGCKKEC